MSSIDVVMPAAWHPVKLCLHIGCSGVPLSRCLEHGAAGMPYSQGVPAST